MKKRTLSIVFALLLCLALLPTLALAEEDKIVDANTTELNGGTYYLSTTYYEPFPDVFWDLGGVFALNNTIHVTASSTLDLNGHILSAEECEDEAEQGKTLLIVESGATLTLTDSSGYEGGFNGTENSTAAIVVEDGGKLVMECGVIDEFGKMSSSSAVGGVHVKSGGSFEMKGGTIRNCQGSVAGGVYLENGAEFTMTGGTITGCKGKKAGGVYLGSGSTFQLTDGTISGCSSENAGGVYVGESSYLDLTTVNGSFQMTGGTITGCSGVTVGGVYLQNYAEFTMSGGTIESCKNTTMSETFGGANTTSAITVFVADSSQLTLKGTARIGNGSATISNIKNIFLADDLYANGGTVSGSVQCGRIRCTGSSVTTFAGSVTANGNIENGTFHSNVTVQGDIKAGTFNGNVNVTGKIETGKFEGPVNVNGTITNGTFDGSVTVSGEILGGNFQNSVTVNGSGKILDGSYYGPVTVHGEIQGGDFYDTVDIDGEIYSVNGSFTESSTVTLMNAESSISFGTFRGTVDNTAGGKVDGGNFAGATLINIATLHFTDTVLNSVDETIWLYNAPIVVGFVLDPAAPGHIFKGWMYAVGDGNLENKLVFDQLGGIATSNITEDMRLEPMWSPITYTIRLDDGGEYYSDFPTTTVYELAYDIVETSGGTVTLPTSVTLPTMSMDGRQFVGWQDDDGNVYSGTVKELTTVDGATVTLYPKWAGQTVELSYDCNGGTHEEGSFFTEHAIAGGTMTYPSAPTREGYRFVGWTPELTEIPDRNTTFTAQWDANIVQVSTNRGNSKKNYPNLSIAHDEAGEGDCITLLADITYQDLSAVRNKLTVDLGGFTLTCSLTFTGENQTLRNGTLNGSLTGTGSGFTLEDLTVTGAVTLSDTGTLHPGTVFMSGIKTTAEGKTLSDYLPPYAAFEKNGKIVSGNVRELSGLVRVVVNVPATVTPVGSSGNKETASIAFTDVSADAYYAKAVAWAVEQGITSGVDDKHFAPDLTCTRAQLVTFLYRAAVSSGMDVRVGADTNILSYTDAADVPDYAFEALQWAVGAGIVQGAEGRLMPNDTCTRAQIVTILFRFASAKSNAAALVSGYTDAASVPDYAIEAFQWALEKGIVQGAEGRLMPNDGCTRAQIVTMLHRLLSK